MHITDIVKTWSRVLCGRPPMLSIEITRECPLRCPGCYAYGDAHLGGGLTLRDLADRRGAALVEGILGLVARHRPVHVSLIGGEPLVRHRELSQVLPQLSTLRINTLVVTSAVLPIPRAWRHIPKLRVAVSVDGLPEDHDVRRHPATYERILQNIEGRSVDIGWVVTAPMLQRTTYLEEYLSFWTARPEVNRIALSLYTPQVDERSPERLSVEARRDLLARLPDLKRRFPALVLSPEMLRGLQSPPQRPADCTFAKMSANYSADLETRVEPCVFGGTPVCAECGCAATAVIGGVAETRIAGLKLAHVMNASVAVGRLVARPHANPRLAE